MIRRLSLGAALILGLLAAGLTSGIASAQVLPPHRFFGSLTINGQPAPAGTAVNGFIGGTDCAGFITTTAGRYVLDVFGASQQAGCGRPGATIEFRVNGTATGQTASFRNGGYEQLDLAVGGGPAPSGFNGAVLFLGDPRPCIPEANQAACDATRTALWNGEAAAWAARGVTDGDARFNETVVFRIRASDPAVIAIIARFLEAPYLQVTGIRFTGDEWVEITNLGGGSQDMTGWSLRSPSRSRVYNFPAGFIMAGGQKCRVYTGAPQSDSCGGTSFNSSDVWPDDAGQVILFFDALALPGAEPRYSADPNNQPPPPNLVGTNLP